ncbi:MAG: hypothetical protein NZ518_10390, partial [Dehalococcoidia bacterium]|nr:hypothetical protein [Dehalococcoidia bacterium]
MTTPILGPSFITYVGDITEGPASAMVARAHRAIALDVVANARRSGAFERIIVVTDSPELAASLPPDVVVEAPSRPFHFGRHLAGVVARHRLARPVYLSRGALPLLTEAELAQLADRLRATQELVLSNNPYSADLVAWTPGDAIGRIAPPTVDNSLARALERQAG